MKPSAIRLLRSAFGACKQMATLAVLSALLTLAATRTQAATRYWDGGSADIATTGDRASDGGGGTWDTTLKNWDEGNGLAHVAWVNGSNKAEIDSASSSITLGANITLGGITQKAGASRATINAGSGPGTLTVTSPAGFASWQSANGTTVTMAGNDVKYTFPIGTKNFVRLKVTEL